MKHVRITAAILVVLAILPLTAVLAWAGTETALPVEYPTCYQQTDKRWADKELIGPNGCGLISLVNAVHYITGNFIDPVPLAIYAHEIDAYNGSVGGGTARWVLYGNLKNYEEKYGFRVDNAGKDAGVTNKAFIEHLEQGGVAICHVYGHFIAIMDYDPQNNTYLVYDCAANLQKRFSYPRATWLTQAKLTKSQYMTVDWWCLLSATKVARNSFDGGTSAINREATGTVCARAGEKVSLSGTVSHTDGVESVYCTVDYDFSKEYPLQAEKTEDGVRYTGSLETEGFGMGEHLVRITARTAKGGLSDIAEISLRLDDGEGGYDAQTGRLHVNMSGYAGQSNVYAASDKGAVHAAHFRTEPGACLSLGRFDLSGYEAVIVRYATTSGYAATVGGVTAPIGLKSEAISYGKRGQEPDRTAEIAASVLEDGTEGGWADVREAVLDLRNVHYSGPLYLSAYSQSNRYQAVVELIFCEKYDFPETDDTETTAQPATDGTEQGGTETAEITTAVAAKDSEGGTETQAQTEAPKTGGCASVLGAGAVIGVFGIAAIAVCKRRREDGRT